jgi:trimeric autotransporter adhesin
MKSAVHFKTATLPILITLALVCIALLPKAQAVSPAPDGGYPGGNTAEGQSALFSLTSGGYNTAVGYFSLRSDTTSSFNTATGAGTLLANTGDQNTATGAGALLSNTTGFYNTANGAFALFSNTTGENNTANGALALSTNTTGGDNTATGSGALSYNTEGVSNTADGDSGLASNTTGSANTAVGSSSLLGNTAGSFNIALGHLAGFHLTTGDYNIDIGNGGFAGEAHTIRIGDDINQGATFIAGIYGLSVSGLTVVMDSSNRLGTVASSRRFKEKIRPMANASEAILALEPVSFRYKKEIDPAGTSQFGLVAEEVEKVNPDLVVRDKEGKPYTVRYDAVNAMLLNEFLKEHRKVQKLETALETLSERLKAQDAKIQKVSAQVELNKAATKLANENR